MHQSSFNIMTRFRELVERQYPQNKIAILDVGSYGVNGTYREIFSDPEKYLYTGLDVNPGPNVDYVPSDPYDWPEMREETFDVVISGQAFEHIEYPWLIVEEMKRVLKKDGLICIVAPSRGPEHKYPVDCWRYYPDGFRALAKWANLQVLDAKTTWGKSGFADGSDQWGDTFCILYKPANKENALKRPARAKKRTSATHLNNPLRQNKQSSYYGFARPEVLQAIRKNNLPSDHVLEIGCAGGATGKSVKEALPVQSYVGIEISPDAAEIAKKHLDRVIVADIEASDLARDHGLQYGQFDLLLALDVLEHLHDPWDRLADMSRFVKAGGHVVVSLPNIQNISIVQDLIAGKWRYEDAGILDATHLRFFTLEGAKELLTGAGLTIRSVERVINPAPDMAKVKETGNTYRHGKLTISDLSRDELLQFFTYQHIIIAKKTPSPATAKTHAFDGMAAAESMGQDQPVRRFKHDEIRPGVVSIVMLTFNQLEYTKKCLKSLRRHTPEPHEVILVDNGSKDGTVKWLRGQVQENKNYSLIENKENLGFAGGCNQGMEAARGEFILLLNNDVVVSEGWLSGLLECLNHAPAAGIVGPMTNNISGPQQIVSDEYRSVDYLDRYAAEFRERYRHRRIPLRRIVGFCMLFRRSLAEQVGMLDEAFGTGNFEDDDFCLRAALAGYRNYVAGDVFIHHFGSRSFIGNRIDYGTSISGNRKIIDRKWTLNTGSTEGKRLAVLKISELAEIFHRHGSTDRAVETLIDGIKIAPEKPEIYEGLCRMLIESKRFSEAWEVVESMPEAVRESLRGLECAAYAKEGLGLDEEAAAFADLMLTLREAYAPALNLRGVLAFKKGDLQSAEDDFRRAIEADPGYGEPRTNLGVLQWSAGRQDEGLQNLEKGFVLSPLVPDHSSLYYSAVSSRGRFAGAEVLLRDARKFYPNIKTLLYLYIDTLVQQEKWDTAMPEIEDALIAFGLEEGLLKAALSVREKTGPLRIDRAAKRGTLSLCMIVKNEEKHLAKCLRSVRGVVDEMIVVDTGSTDKTMDIARIFGARVFEIPWTGDFSAARNQSLAKAGGDWVLVLDADEVISERDFGELTKITRKRPTTPVAYSIVTRNYTTNVGILGFTPNDGTYPEEAGAGWGKSPKVRLYPRRKDVFFSNPVHELLENSLIKAGIPVRPCKVVVHHYGKLDVQRDVKKGEDYYLLGKIKYDNDPTNVKYIYELAKQAQALDKNAEAVTLWLELLSFIEAGPESAGYREIARYSVGDPLSDLYTQLASAYLKLEHYQDALAAARKAMQGRTRLKEYVQVYAHCEVIAGSPDKASAALEDLSGTTPDYPPALFLQAVIFCLERKNQKAIEIFQLLRHERLQVTPLINAVALELLANGKKSEALLVIAAAVEGGLADEETAGLRDSLING